MYWVVNSSVWKGRLHEGAREAKVGLIIGPINTLQEMLLFADNYFANSLSLST